MRIFKIAHFLSTSAAISETYGDRVIKSHSWGANSWAPRNTAFQLPIAIDSLTLQAEVRAVQSGSADELDEEIDSDLEH